jgi:hypothetical protein
MFGGEDAATHRDGWPHFRPSLIDHIHSCWINNKERKTVIDGGTNRVVDVKITEAVTDHHELGSGAIDAAFKLAHVPSEQRNAWNFVCLVATHDDDAITV